MAKIVRKAQKIFGVNAGFQQIAQFGSLANTTPNFTTDPDVIQALAQFTNGWFDAVIGGNSPAIEDMNAYCYLVAYQLAYLMQEGIAEWDATTTYFIGSVVSDGDGNCYVSIADNNLNNVFSVAGKWRQFLGWADNIPAPLTVTIASGKSLSNPLLTISSSAVYTVQSGGALYSVDTLICLGTLTINSGGRGRVI
jgi:hypothetical protein